MEERETGARPEKEPKCKIFSEPDTPPCVGVYDNRQKGGPPVRQEESSGGGTEEMQSRGRSAPALRPLSAGRWIVMFFLTVFLVLFLCAAFNISVDPFGVFGDRMMDWPSYDQTNNPRVGKIVWLEENKGRYDSFIIGSSSAASYSAEEFSDYTGDDYYNLFVYGCDTKCYRNLARYVIEEQNAKNIVLNLGINETNSYDTDRSSLNESEHERVSGENPLRFYLKYALCNPKYSVEKLRSARLDTELPQAFDVFLPESGCYDKRVRDVEPVGDEESYLQTYTGDFVSAASEMEYIDECVASVKYIRDLCEKNDVSLTVICSPVYASQWDGCPPEKLKEYKRKLAEVTDYWDFSMSSLSEDSRYFYDALHFRNAAGSMALARIFGNGSVWIPEDFGTYVTAENVEGFLQRIFADGAENGGNAEPSNDVDVPVLMYHHLAERPNESTIVTPETFEHQLQVISDAGYHTVTVQDLIRYVYSGEELPENPVCITFDDGYLSNYEIAYPLLKKYGMKATIFVIGSSVGCSEYKESGRKIKPHFSWAQAAEMMDSGLIDIQSHTWDMHQWCEGEGSDTKDVRESAVPLKGETESEYIGEFSADIREFQRVYAEKTGRRCNVISYPQGQYSVLSEVTAAECGIQATLVTETGRKNTLIKGLPQSLRVLSRSNVTESTTDEELLEKLKS